MSHRFAGLATSAWVLGNLGARRRFAQATADCRAAQARVCGEVLDAVGGTTFARAHGLARVRTPEALREAVPARDYDGLAPYIERVANGEPDVLTNEAPQHRITGFEPSSGSAAAVKLIPSNALLRAQFQRAIGAWVAELYLRRPALLGGPSYWSISPALPHRRTPGGLPVGFAEDSAYLGGLSKRLVDLAMAVPGDVAQIHDIARFRRATLLSLLEARDLRLISVWNPTFLTLLLDEMAARWGELIDALADPARAAELRRLSPDALRQIWPKLALVSCWADGSAAAPFAALQARLGGVEIQPKGLIATEAFCTLPFGGGYPLAVSSHLFELEQDDGRLLWAHELAPGDRGTLIVSTGGGLVRYRLRDRVMVSATVGDTPSLRFLGKEDRVSDRCGEKLHEAFVAEVLHGLGLSLRFAMLAPEDGPPPYYALFLTGESAADLPRRLDAALGANPHYAWCRQLGQLGPARVVPLVGDAFSAYIEACQRAGQRLGDIKPAALSARSGWTHIFCPEVER